MLYWLKRHPLPIRAFFCHSLVLTYAFPQHVLSPLLPPGLAIDSYRRWGFLAIAMVQTSRLRPAFFPGFTGQDFFLAGYRIFARFRTSEGRTLRGLRILRSDANRRLMVAGGNLLTHYNYQLCSADVSGNDAALEVRIRTADSEGDLHVQADLTVADALPDGSPFESAADARRFAGPLPWTFDYEPQTHSIIAIKGVREHWRPQLVNIRVLENRFIEHPRFDGVVPVLASAFYVSEIPYRWNRGVRYPLEENHECLV